MRKLITINLILYLLFAIQSCEKKTSDKISDHPKNKKEISVIENDSDIHIVKDFLKWYKNNQNELYQFNSIKGGILLEDESADNYYVDFKEVDKEVRFLSDSKLFTQNFLDQYKKRYVEGDEQFRQDPQNDGPPFGFDYNYFFMTQDDYESDLKNIDKIKFNSLPQSDSIIYITFHLANCGMTYRYILKKEDDRWKIDKIENIS